MAIQLPEPSTRSVAPRERLQEVGEGALGRRGLLRIRPAGCVGERGQDSNPAKPQTQESTVQVGPWRVRSEVRRRARLDLAPIDDLARLADVTFAHRVGEA